MKETANGETELNSNIPEENAGYSENPYSRAEIFSNPPGSFGAPQ